MATSVDVGVRGFPLALVRALGVAALAAASLAMAFPAAAAEPPASSAVDFELSALDGARHRLADHRGSYVIVNFWATWCAPCIRELPALVSFAEANPDVVVLTVNFETIDEAPLRAFVDEVGLTLPVLRVGDTPLVPFEPLKGLPTTVIVDPKGTIIAHHAGEVTEEALTQFLAGERARR